MASFSSQAVQVPAMIRESDGALLVWTSGGYRTAGEAGISLDDSGSSADVLGPPVYVPPNSKNFLLKSAGVGGINDWIRVIRVVPTGTGPDTTCKLTDG